MFPSTVCPIVAVDFNSLYAEFVTGHTGWCGHYGKTSRYRAKYLQHRDMEYNPEDKSSPNRACTYLTKQVRPIASSL